MTHLFNRLVAAKKSLAPVQSQYCIVWEDPTDLDAPCKITVPDPNWMACAMAGGILPPVDVYHHLEMDEQGRITNGHTLHETPPVAAMTEEEAIEYLVQKDLPQRVWADNSGNRTRFKITLRASVPADRSYRNAWRLAA